MPSKASSNIETNKKQIQRDQEKVKQRMHEARQALRDISPIDTSNINWELRKACKYNLKLFLQSYLPNMFCRSFSQSHEVAIDRMQRTSLETTMFSVAMPRGEGKTTISIGTSIWDQAYAHRRYPIFIGSDQESADSRLTTIKEEWYLNELLLRDFPELAYPVVRIEGRNELTKGQRHNGKPTMIEWAMDEMHFASLVFTPDEIMPWIENDCADDLIQLDDDGEFWSIVNNGNIMKSKGIGGNIRGPLYRHPLTGLLLRPDKFILDDVQTDKVAENPNSVRKLVAHINGAIKGLADPKIGIAGVNLCTVRSMDDASEYFLDREKRPEWQAHRCSMVIKWPDGITDTEITDATEESQLWSTYAEIRKASLKEHGDIRDATTFYTKNRDVMDRGFEVDNPERFTDKVGEISAQQHAMNLRLYDLITFMAEYMNRPLKELSGGTILIVPETVQRCVTNIPRYMFPSFCTEVCAFIDVGDEILWYGIAGASRSFNIHIPEYGHWPDTGTYITKTKAREAKLITRAFAKAHKNDGASEASVESRIYWALMQAIGHIRGMTFHSEHGGILRPTKIGIDCGWGKVSKTIYKLIFDLRDPNIFPVFGRFIGATSQPFDEYQSRAGVFIGDHLMVKPPSERDLAVEGNVYPIGHLLVDANYWKSFLWTRIATLPGASHGSLSLFTGNHELYIDHVVKSEQPTPVTARGRTIDEWEARPGQDNDLFDVSYNLCAILSLMGCSVDVKIDPKTQHEEMMRLMMEAAIKQQTQQAKPTQPVQQPAPTTDTQPPSSRKGFRLRSWRK